jgi:hypothetical protein
VVAVLVAVWPVLRVFWHWSIEILAGLAVVYGWTALMQTTNVPASLLIVAVAHDLDHAVVVEMPDAGDFEDDDTVAEVPTVGVGSAAPNLRGACFAVPD